MSNYYNRELPTILTKCAGGFYTVPAQGDLPDLYFTLGDAIHKLQADLLGLAESLSDVPSATQLELINEAYAKFVASLPAAEVPIASKSTQKRVAVQSKKKVTKKVKKS